MVNLVELERVGKNKGFSSFFWTQCIIFSIGFSWVSERCDAVVSCIQAERQKRDRQTNREHYGTGRLRCLEL